MSMTCPDCHAELEPQNGVAHCENCKKDIPLEARCPECHQPLGVKSLRCGGLLLSEWPWSDLEETCGVCAGLIWLFLTRFLCRRYAFHFALYPAV